MQIATPTEYRRAKSALLETDKFLTREQAYLPANQDLDLITFLQRHKAQLETAITDFQVARA